MSDYQRIAQIIRYLDEHQADQPDLATLAQEVGLSPSHFHRLFSRWAGITPKDFLQCLTLAHAKTLLRRGETVMHTALGSGLSGSGRLHDLCVDLEAASPGEIKVAGRGWTIDAGFAETPFGLCLVGEGPRGLCHLSFVEEKSRARAEGLIREQWCHASIVWSDVAAVRRMAPLFPDAETIGPSGARPTLRAFVSGTDFQVRVWRALLKVPEGWLISYGQLAAAIGMPSAARAVGTAVGKNPLAYLIPCHRVIRETGAFGQYRWDTTRKKAMLGWEGTARIRTLTGCSKATHQ